MLRIVGTNIKLTRGDSAIITANIYDGDDNLYTLQGGDILELAIKKDIASDKVLQKLSDGDCNFVFSPKDTNSLEFGKYIYDVQLTTKEGAVYTVVPPSLFIIDSEVNNV